MYRRPLHYTGKWEKGLPLIKSQAIEKWAQKAERRAYSGLLAHCVLLTLTMPIYAKKPFAPQSARQRWEIILILQTVRWIFHYPTHRKPNEGWDGILSIYQHENKFRVLFGTWAKKGREKLSSLLQLVAIFLPPISLIQKVKYFLMYSLLHVLHKNKQRKIN